MQVFEKSIPELQQAMEEGRASSHGIVQAYLARISAYDQRGPVLNAIVTLNPRALEEASRLDRERKEKGPRGPLHGIPILVKDNFATIDMPTSAGTLALATFQTDRDAFQVKKLRDAGAIILGKTAMHELAMGLLTVSSLTGESRNPYDPRRTPGGSSGGSAAAVAASFAAAALGSDTCGSIRQPAAHQNLYGLRGTAGLSSRAGIVPLSPTQDEGGPLARSVSDLAVMLDATVGADGDDPVTLGIERRDAPPYNASLVPGGLRGARIGILREYMNPDDIDRAIKVTLDRALDKMKAEGAVLVDVVPAQLQSAMANASVIDFEFRTAFDDFVRGHPGAPITGADAIASGSFSHQAVAERVKARSDPKPRDEKAYKAALKKREAVRGILIEAMDAAKVDALIYPVAMQPPALWGSRFTGKPTCQISATSGLPALAIPLGLSSDALPVGLDLLGRPYSEQALIRIAYGWEKAASPRRPPFSTPALIEELPPGPPTFRVRVGDAKAQTPFADIAFTLDPGTSHLRYDVTIRGLGHDKPLVVTLQSGDSDQAGPVVAVLLRGKREGSGEVVLEPKLRGELASGRLYAHLYTVDHPLGAGRALLPRN